MDRNFLIGVAALFIVVVLYRMDLITLEAIVGATLGLSILAAVEIEGLRKRIDELEADN